MVDLYRRLLVLYPPLHRYVFADEMLAVFREAEAEESQKGTVAHISFCIREAAGLIRGAGTAHLRAIAETYPWCTFYGRSVPMTPERRHPRSSIVLMSVSLALVVIAIAKAQGLSFALERLQQATGGTMNLDLNGPGIGPLHFGLLGSIVVFCAIAWIMGVIAWGIMFVTRRAGVHRLDNAETWPH